MSWKTWSTWVRFTVVFGAVLLLITAAFVICFLQYRPVEPIVCTLLIVPAITFFWGFGSIFRIPAQSPFWDWLYYIFNITFYGLVAAGIAFLAARRRAQ